MRRALIALFAALFALVGSHQSAAAFCGFYVSGADAKLFNNATVVVLLRDGMRTVLSMQNNYQGPPEDFALVIPVPVVLQKENVKTLTKAIFDRVDQAAAPRLVEYWEQDPCPTELPDLRMRKSERAFASSPAPGAAATASADLGVKIEAEFTVGEYNVLILSAEDALGLDTWLRRENYKIPTGAGDVLRPYVQGGMKFFVAKVDVKKVTFKDGQAMLSPLRFHYDSDTFSLPIRLGLINSNGAQDLIVHVLGKKRYEVANYPNVTIPTNLDVAEAAREEFGSFYASLFDATLEKSPGAVVTEYSWDAGSCDPCPSPALTPQELLTLGVDVLPFAPNDYEKRYPSASIWRRTSGFVLTRLHARYTKSSLGEDLVFREATPIWGGREVRSKGGELEHGSSPGYINNFQGRYAIRHPWTGPITCVSPRRGVWGGPPRGHKGPSGPKAARDLAFVKRGASLASFLRSDVPEIGVRAGGLAPGAAPVTAGAYLRVGVIFVVFLGTLGLIYRMLNRDKNPARG